MNADMLAHFGFALDPFSKELEDSDLWLPPSKQQVLEDLTDAMHAKASVSLSGDPGVGKTCLLRALRHALPKETFRLTYCQQVTLGRRDFYRQLCLALGLARAPNTAGEVFFAISSHIEELAKDKLFPVFLIDEAHLLHQDTLDHLHILLNFCWDSRALLSLVLIGLPELDDRLRLRRNRSLFSRLSYRLSISALAPEDTADYLRTRCTRVGGSKDLFPTDTATLIHEAAGGHLRDTDRIASAALRLAARKKRKTVDRDIVSRALQTEAGGRA